MSQFASPEDLEKHHVRDVYDKIAPHFVGSRHKAWPRVEEFLLSLPLGSLIADVGCGSGKYLGLAPESFVIGSDSCTEFGEIAAKRGHNIVACDNQDLSFRDSCFDAVISVGVIHHFASVKRRTKALEELYRILRPGGRMLVYVWAFEQDERKFDGQDVLVPYTHYQRNKVLARRSMSTPERPRHHSQSHRGAPNVSAASWRARRAYSFDDSRYDHAHNQKHKERADRTRHRNHDSSVEKVHSTAPSKYTILESIRNQGTAAPSRLEAEDTPVKKLSKFINSFIKKIFDDDESQKLSSDHTQTKEQAKDVSVDTNTDFGAKFSALVSYFSAENREKYFKAEFLSLMAKRLFPSKDHMHLVHEFGQSSADSEGIRDEFSPRQETEEHTHPVHEFGQSSADSEEIGDEFSPRQETEEHDVIICMKEERGNAHDQVGEGSRKLNGVNLGVMARLVDSLASLSDLDSDSSSSSDYLTSDSSAAEEWDRAESSLAHSKKTFQHTTIRCQEPVEPVCAADSQYSSTSSSFSSSTRSLSSSSSPSPSASSSSSSPVATTSQKKVKSKLFQRYYHVFRAGELVRLAQEGIPSAVVLKEYYDHGNWAVILVKTVGRHGLRNNSEMI